jgi:hypothetical protein
MDTLLRQFYSPDTISSQPYCFSSISDYFIPNSEQIETIDSAIAFVSGLPEINCPELVGLSGVAFVAAEKYEGDAFISSVKLVGAMLGDSSK